MLIMKIKPYIFAGSIFLLLTACAPQAELVKTKSEVSDLREDVKVSKTQTQEQKRLNQDIQKRLDALDAAMKSTVDVQKLTADYGAKMDELTTDIQLLQGKLEENNFRIADLNQKLDDKSFRVSELSARVDEIEAKLKSLAAGQGVVSGPSGTAEKKAGPKAVEPSEAYRQAWNDFNSGNYDLALAGFQNYLSRFPDASQADKALYWIGECYYSKKEYPKAIEQFSKVIKTFPKSDKVAGAKLKIGYSYLNENHTAKAKEWLHKVVKEHPGVKEAELAKEKLRKIGK
jgi:tol-pal system protein YbgF